MREEAEETRNEGRGLGARAAERRKGTEVWVFRDVVFQDVGF